MMPYETQRDVRKTKIQSKHTRFEATPITAIVLIGSSDCATKYKQHASQWYVEFSHGMGKQHTPEHTHMSWNTFESLSCV